MAATSPPAASAPPLVFGPGTSRPWRFVAAIDFGTSRTGLATSSLQEALDAPAIAAIVARRPPFTVARPAVWHSQRWPGADSHKTRTDVLLEWPSKKLKQFGHPAQAELFNTDDDSQGDGDADGDADGDGDAPRAAPSVAFFKAFKMLLFDKDDAQAMRMRPIVQSFNSPLCSVPSVELIGTVLAHVSELALQRLQQGALCKGAPVSRDDVLWVLTVPAIWKEPAKQIMREAAVWGGLIPSVSSANLLLALEPEAALAWCRSEGGAQHAQDTFHEGYRYLVVDCGGGTVDTIIHEVQAHGGLAELASPHGGPWGATYIDQAFRQFLYDLFGLPCLQSFARIHPELMHQLMTDWATMGMQAYAGVAHTKYRIPLPHALTHQLQTSQSSVQEKVDQYNQKHQRAGADPVVQWQKSKLVLSELLVRQLFDTAVDPLLAHIRELLHAHRCHALYLVGGMAESAYVQSRIGALLRSHFAAAHLIVPAAPSLTVVSGAVVQGLNHEAQLPRGTESTQTSTAPPTPSKPHLVRKAPYTVGCAIAKRAPTQLGAVSSSARVPGFHAFVRAGDRLPDGHAVSVDFRPVPTSQGHFEFDIFRSPAPSVDTVRDRGCQPLAKIYGMLAERPGVPFHTRRLQLRLVFDSQLRVEAREVDGSAPIHTLIDCFGGHAGAAAAPAAGPHNQHNQAAVELDPNVQMDVG